MVLIVSSCVWLIWSAYFLLAEDFGLSVGWNVGLMIFLVKLSEI